MIPAFVRTAVATAALISSLAACTSLHVTSDVNADLIGSVHCRTFAWAGSFRGASPLRGTIANPVNEIRLRAAISAHFAASGVQEATADPDCLVGYGIGARDVVAGAYPYGYGYYGWGWGYPYGPYGRTHGLRHGEFFDPRERYFMLHPVMHVWNKTITTLTAETLLELFQEAVDLRPPDPRSGIW